jgi:hypothetical protein
MMEIDHKATELVAAAFLGVSPPLQRLGWGITGDVYLSPDLRTAVKVHRREESYARELEVYRRLRKLNIIELHGLSVPKLRGWSDKLKVIQMDAVSPPFLLDFAGVLFSSPDYSADAMQHWYESINERYGPNAHIAYAVYHELLKHGLYYMDFRPSNMCLTGLPGLEPFDPSLDDDSRY